MSDRPLAGFGTVVVGGSRGIGAAVSALLADCGAGVVVNGRDAAAVDATVKAIVDAGGRAVAHAGSAADEAVAEDLIALCEKEFGAVDALVNCAGAPEPPGSSILDRHTRRVPRSPRRPPGHRVRDLPCGGAEDGGQGSRRHRQHQFLCVPG